MGRLGWGRDSDLIRDLCAIRMPLVWRPDLTPSVLLKDHESEFNDGTQAVII